MFSKLLKSRFFSFCYLRSINLRNKRSIMSSADNTNLLTLDTINPNAIMMEYAVRGPLVTRAAEIEKELKQNIPKPFNHVIRANIGDCHAMGQKPLKYIRQFLSCALNPSLMNTGIFPNDIVNKVKILLDACNGKSVGSYSDSAGIELIRKHCAEYISSRDGYPSDYNDIFLSGGASEAVREILSLINTGRRDNIPVGVMIPIPQYPLYTATIAEYDMYAIKYYLDEDNAWALNMNELERSLAESKGKCKPKALVVINPGNPTGSVLTKQNIEEIIKFAYNNKLVLIADEVYQHNIYAENARFFSFKKIISEMGIKLELASIMSASKGYMGECGLRGGYCEFINLDPKVKAILNKMRSAKLCSSIIGQFTIECIVNPPKPGDESYEEHEKEKNEVLLSLKKRAELAADTFNSIEGMKSNQVAGAMYAFPKLTFPDKLIEDAKEKGLEPDFFYAMNLLENTGICVVPGSGFGQIPGTYHFRTTILPQPDDLITLMNELKKFHYAFISKYT